jgi:hypothetical protein
VLVVSWNVAGRKSRLDEQADRVLELEKLSSTPRFWAERSV